MAFSTACLRFLAVLGSKSGTQRLQKIFMRDAFIGGGRSSSGVEIGRGVVVVACRVFLGFKLGRSWESLVRGGRPQGVTAVFRFEAHGALSAALVRTVSLSSVKLSSLHSSSGSPFGWARVLRKREKAATSPYFCWRRFLVSVTVPVYLSSW